MSPEMISIIGVGVGLLTALVAFAGVVITLLLRLERRIDRIDARIDHTNNRIDLVVAEVSVIAQNQARIEQQMKDLVEQVKVLTARMEVMTAELKAIDQRQSRLEGEMLVLKDAVLHRAGVQE